MRRAHLLLLALPLAVPVYKQLTPDLLCRLEGESPRCRPGLAALGPWMPGIPTASEDTLRDGTMHIRGCAARLSLRAWSLDALERLLGGGCLAEAMGADT